MATKYSRGRAWEYKVRDDLRARGYLVVRSAGSKGKVDLMAVMPVVVTAPSQVVHHPGCILLVQCKNKGWGKPSEREALCELATQYGALAILASAGSPGIAYRHYSSCTQYTIWGNG